MKLNSYLRFSYLIHFNFQMNFPLYLVGVLTLFATLLLASPIINQGNSTVSQSDETEKVPISFNDVIVTGLGTRGFSGTWISGNLPFIFLSVSTVPQRQNPRIIRNTNDNIVLSIN